MNQSTKRVQYGVAVVVWLLLVAGSGIAAVEGNAQDVRFRRIGLNEGLPQSYVNGISEDAQGYLWIATQDGLAQYDGRRMVVHRQVPGDSASLCGNNVSVMLMGTDSSVAVSTGAGWCTYDARQGRWLAGKRVRSTIPNRHTLAAHHTDSLNVTYTDRGGRRWIGTVKDGLRVEDHRTGEATVFSVREGRGRWLPVHDVWALCEDRRGRMWVGLNGGGIVVIDSLCVVARYRHDPRDPSSISSDVVRYLYEDAIGTMWIGTHGGGLCQYDPYMHVLPRMQPTRHVQHAADNFIRGIAASTASGSSNVYVGTRYGVLQTDTALSQTSVLVSWRQNYEAVGAARALVVCKNGALWVGTERGGVGVVARGASRITWLPHLSRRAVSCIVADGPDHVLIGMDNRIARVHHRTYATEWYSVPDSPLPTEPLVPVSAIARLGEGDYLVGTEFGLYRGPLTDLTRKVRCSDSLAVRPNIDIIRSIEVEVEGGDTVAYVSTWGGGVRCINLTTQHETVIDSRRGLPSNTTYAAYAAHASSGQRLLISSNAGVIVWDLPSDGVDRVLTPLQGAQSYEFNSWSHARISQGLIALGGVDGLNLWSLESMAVPPPPTVTIMRNGVSERDVWYTASAMALSGAAEVVYRYRLHYDEPWISSSDVAIHTAELSAGDYTLQVQAGYRTGGSVTYGPVTHAQWSVPVPWWRSWWSISAVAMMIAGSVWWSASAVAARRERHRSEQERLVHQERVRIARDLHDDVGTGLTRLVLLADQAEPDRASVSRIAHTAQDVIERVRSIVWVMKATDRSMLRTVEYVRSKIADMFHHAGMTFTSTVEITADGDADPMVMRSVVLALQEAATNVVRHSQASHVRMKVWSDSNVLHILLEDDGIGFDVSGSHAGNGSQHIVARASEAGGTAHIASQPGQGTVVQLTLPIKPLTPGRESSL